MLSYLLAILLEWFSWLSSADDFKTIITGLAGLFGASKIWDFHLPSWRDRKGLDLSDPNIKHNKLVKHFNQFKDAPALSDEEVDFDISNPDNLAIQRSIRKKKGAWYQVPKNLEPKNRRREPQSKG